MTQNKFGKCAAFPILDKSDSYLVTGIKNEDYNYCSIARQYDDMCGIEGKHYKNKLSKNEKLK